MRECWADDTMVDGAVDGAVVCGVRVGGFQVIPKYGCIVAAVMLARSSGRAWKT